MRISPFDITRRDFHRIGGVQEYLAVIRGLLEKEWRQHGLISLFIAVLLLAGLQILQSTSVIRDADGSTLSLLSRVLLAFYPLGCLVMANSLIAGEFRQKTQIFLEGLPLHRWLMITVKYLFGLTMVLGLALALLAVSIWSSRHTEAFTSRFLGLLIGKTIAWGWFCWATVFMHAFLGRYRILIGVVVVFGLLYAQNEAGVEIGRFGPFELISERFAFERNDFPTTPFAWTLLLVVLLTTVGFALGLVRDATLATLLSERMSSREKTVMTAIAVLGVMLMGSAFERNEKTDPLDLPGAIDIQRPATTVSAAAAVLAPSESELTLLSEHSNAIASSLSSAAKYLGISKLPPVFLVHRRDFETGKWEFGSIDSRQGFLIRYNMEKTSPQSTELHSVVLEKTLNVHQHYRLSSDTRGWILTGFAEWWARKSPDLSSASLPSTQGSDSSAEAEPSSGSTPKSIRSIDIQQWKKYAKELDDEKTVRVVAMAGVECLQSIDEERCRKFLSAVLSYAAHHDVRATIHDALHPVHGLLKRHLELDMDTLATRWSARLSPTETKP